MTIAALVIGYIVISLCALVGLIVLACIATFIATRYAETLLRRHRAANARKP